MDAKHRPKSRRRAASKDRVEDVGVAGGADTHGENGVETPVEAAVPTDVHGGFTKMTPPTDEAGADAIPPRLDEVGDTFFEELYLALNPDVAAAVANGIFATGEEHWLKHGAEESAINGGLRSSLTFGPPARQMTLAQTAETSRDFDPISYLYLHPDVRGVTRGDANAARDHWTHHGNLEGRMAPGVLRPAYRTVDLGKMAKRPLGFNLIGAFGQASGMGTAARSMAKAVKATGLPFELHAIDTSTGEFRPVLTRPGMRPTYNINLILANADQAPRVFAAYGDTFFDDAYNIGVWQWELSSPRSDSFYAFDGIDEVWTNSAFQHDAIQSFAPVPVTTIHLPVVATRHRPLPSRQEFGIPPDCFVFIMPFDIGSTSARKNPLAAIEAFKTINAEFPRTHLVLKYHSGRFESTFLRDLLSSVAGSPNITIISSEFVLSQLDRLRESCDCLISAHRSEGFGLNIAEFLALGKPVIATNYSGNVDFFDDTVGFPIDYEITELSKQAGPYQPGFTWAEPSISSMVGQMRRVLTEPELVRERTRQAVAGIANLLSVERVSGAIKARIEALELDRPMPTFLKSLTRGDKVTRETLASNPGASAKLGGELGVTPMLSVVVPVYNVPPQYLEQCIESVRAQTYPYWELCICDDCSTAQPTIDMLESYRGSSPLIKIIRSPRNGGIADATNRAISLATGQYVVLLDNDDVLMPTALEEVARAVVADPDIDVLYTDEDKIDAAGNKIDHFLKPDWSPEHLESVMYLLHMLVVRKDLWLKLGGLRAEYDGAQDYDLALRCSRATNRIHHIAKVLYRWRAIPGSAADVVDAKPVALQNGMRALADHARTKYGPLARVEAGLLPGTFRLRRPLAHPAPVSLLILTGNAHLELPDKGEVCLVENLVASILGNTDYPNYRIIVVDNSTLAPEQLERFRALGVDVRNFVSEGPFNYAAKANFAMRGAPTDSIVLMNDDMEVIRPDWLTSLIELSSDPGIGAVGARLLHMDGSIQHVGTVLGVNTGAAHVYHSYPRDFVGYNGFTHIIRNYSAVTAACLATRRSVAAQVGWMDEKLAIDFNDIDFCLRLVSAGYRVVYTPYAELYHYEGVSAKRTTQDPLEINLFCSRWANVLENDPYYNQNLTRHGLDFAER